MQRHAATVLLASALMLVAAGCGSSKSAEQKYAESVCSALGDWKTSVQTSVNDVKSTVQSPSVGMMATINTDVASAVDATKKLQTDLQSIEAPNSDSGKQAKQQIEALGTQLNQTVTKTKQTVSDVPSGASATEIFTQLSTLVPSLQTLVTSVSTTISSVQASSQAFKDGFDKADSCKNLR